MPSSDHRPPADDGAGSTRGTAVVERALAALDRAAGLRVTVVGPAVVDQVLVCRPRRRPRRDEEPWLELVATEHDAGGAAAAAVALSGLGAWPRLVAPIGEDREAEQLRAVLLTAGVSDADLVADPGRPTPSTCRLLSHRRVVARVDRPAPGEPDPTVAEELGRRLGDAADSDAVLVVTDRDAQGLLQRLAHAVPALAAHPCVVVTGTCPATTADLRPRMAVLDGDAVACLVEEEGGGAAPTHSDRARWLASRDMQLRDRTGARAVAVSLPREGSVVLTDGAVLYAPPGPTPRGREDAVRSAWAPAVTLALAAGHDVLAATHLAAATADVPRRGPHAAPVERDLIREAVRRRRPPLPLVDPPGARAAERA